MILSENYNSACQKYGKGLVDRLTQYGLPPKFLLSACRFHTEENIPLDILVNLFRKWSRFVVKNENHDVNTLTFQEFREILENCWKKYCVPNIIYSDEVATMGQINTAADARKIPTPNNWCIKSTKKIEEFVQKHGYKFFVIFIPSENNPYTFVIAAVGGGNVEYWNSNNEKQFEDLTDLQNIDNSEHYIYQRKLPKEIVNYLHNIGAEQTEEKEQNCDKSVAECLCHQYELMHKLGCISKELFESMIYD